MINGVYYQNVLVAKKLMQIIRQIAGDMFMCQPRLIMHEIHWNS
jgi:hypothetical protein